MDTQYQFAGRMAELYGLLEDALSKKIFSARVSYDTTQSVDDALWLWSLAGMLTEEEAAVQLNWRAAFEALNREGRKIVLYGAGTCGRIIGDLFLRDGGAFFGYCDRDAARFTDGLLGKPVVPPSYLLEHAEECYVILSTMDYPQEIYCYLLDNGFPRDHILPFFNKPGVSDAAMAAKAYFDFPALYPKGRAFIDGGCFDGGTSIRFAQWSGGDYSRILAFEPDPENLRRCRQTLEAHPVERLELIQAGLSSQTGSARFAASADASSYMVDTEAGSGSMAGPVRDQKEITEIKTVALDDLTGACPVGFIKLDIEGAEYAALQGARQTLLRDKPFLAICVYHRQGDVLAVMDYLHTLVPEYRFWLRHYGTAGYETVLYASL